MSAIGRLRSEVRRDGREVARDKNEVTKDRRELRKDLKELTQDRKALESGRKTLDQTKKAETRALASIDKERGVVQQQYQDSFDPADPSSTGDPALKARLDLLDTQRTAVDDRFNHKIAAVVKRLQQKRTEVERDRKEVKADRKELKKDRRELVKDKRELRNDKARLKRAIAARGQKGDGVREWVASHHSRRLGRQRRVPARRCGGRVQENGRRRRSRGRQPLGHQRLSHHGRAAGALESLWRAARRAYWLFESPEQDRDGHRRHRRPRHPG